MINTSQRQPKPKPKPKHWIGIDGCHGGWIIAWLKEDHPGEIRFEQSLQPFLKTVPKHAIVLIDMILYKGNDPSPRPFDRLAKAQLGKWHSRVFPAPPKEALIAKDYPDACARSFQRSGKKISKQCYNLFPKIREANHPSIPKNQLIEYHPEIAFKQLNLNTVIEASKKTDLGHTLRQKTLNAHLANQAINFTHTHLKKSLWKPDDRLDALALALVARNGDYKDFYQSLADAKTDA